MKKTLLVLIFFLIGLAVFSQNRVADKVMELQSEKVVFRKVSVLSESAKPPSKKIARVLKNAFSSASIKEEAVNEIVSRKDKAIELEIPYRDKTITLQLYKEELFAQGFHVDTDKEKNVPYEPGVYYRGIIKGDVHSLASLNFFKGELNGIVSGSGVSNLVIGKQPDKKKSKDYIIYEDQKKGNDYYNFICGTTESTGENIENIENIQKSSVLPETEKCVTVYLEMDYDLYRSPPERERSVTTATNWMTSVFNNVQTLFANDGIKIAVKSIYVWTTFDPYQFTGWNSGAYLSKFKKVRPVLDADVGQLVGCDGGFGGEATTVGGLCNNSRNYSYADVLYDYNTVPAFSKTINIMAHELGHLLGSRHTHACIWNGNNTAIDNCGAGYVGEGLECVTNPPTIPSSSVKGTIMSYCFHVGIDFKNGFGPQPARQIRKYVNSMSCLGTDCVNTCVNTVTGINTVRSEDGNSEIISWTDIGNTSSWDISIVPLWSGEDKKYTTVTTNPYNVALQPNKYYSVRIRPTCTEGMRPVEKEFLILTDADYCKGVQITDSGGVLRTYYNDEKIVKTLIPNVANRKIKLTFTEFRLKEDDFLYVYDGSSTSAPLLGGAGFTGTTVPAPIESTAADGALTIKFVSNSYNLDTGWVATTSCTPFSLGLEDAAYVDYSYYPNPVNGFVNITSKDAITEIQVFNVQGQLLYTSPLNDRATRVDMTAYPAGTYLFRMKVNNLTVTFKVVKL